MKFKHHKQEQPHKISQNRTVEVLELSLCPLLLARPYVQPSVLHLACKALRQSGRTELLARTPLMPLTCRGRITVCKA